MGSNVQRHLGFSTIELISVLIIVGVLSAVLISSVSSFVNTNNLFTEVETLKGHLRYAQSRGMGDSVSWGASLTSNTYVLQRNGATASTIWPGENSATHTLPGGVTITTGAGTSITFDSWGSPGSSDIALTLSAGGESQSITITGETGFIP